MTLTCFYLLTEGGAAVFTSSKAKKSVILEGLRISESSAEEMTRGVFAPPADFTQAAATVHRRFILHLCH